MNVTSQFSFLVRAMEILLALFVLVGVIISAVSSVQVLLVMDWSDIDAFYDLIYRILLLVIGIELVKMLIIHDLLAVLELLAFVIARKMLKPELSSFDILLAVAAFVALMWARRYLVPPVDTSDEEPGWGVFKREP